MSYDMDVLAAFEKAWTEVYQSGGSDELPMILMEDDKYINFETTVAFILFEAGMGSRQAEVDALTAQVETLRQGLLMSNCEITECDYSDDDIGIKELIDENLRLVDSTPQQSLIAIKKAERKRCAVVCGVQHHEYWDGVTADKCAEAIRSMDDE